MMSKSPKSIFSVFALRKTLKLQVFGDLLKFAQIGKPCQKELNSGKKLKWNAPQAGIIVKEQSETSFGNNKMCGCCHMNFFTTKLPSLCSCMFKRNCGFEQNVEGQKSIIYSEVCSFTQKRAKNFVSVYLAKATLTPYQCLASDYLRFQNFSNFIIFPSRFPLIFILLHKIWKIPETRGISALVQYSRNLVVLASE